MGILRQKGIRLIVFSLEISGKNPIDLKWSKMQLLQLILQRLV